MTSRKNRLLALYEGAAASALTRGMRLKFVDVPCRDFARGGCVTESVYMSMFFKSGRDADYTCKMSVQRLSHDGAT